VVHAVLGARAPRLRGPTRRGRRGRKGRAASVGMTEKAKRAGMAARFRPWEALMPEKRKAPV